jgi:6-phosphogluconolactonase
MTEVEWWEFDSTEDLVEQMAGDIAFVVDSAVEAHGGARLALAGGEAFEFLAPALLALPIDWPSVTVIPTDERLVPFDDPRSNFGRMRSALSGRGANLMPLVAEAEIGEYREAGRLADERLAELDWPLDLIILGMGDDGHTAAIFPGPDFDRAIAGPRGRRAIGVRPEPMPSEAAVDRVTLTADGLSSARAVMMIVRGDAAKALLERAIEEGPLSPTPIGRLLAELEAPIDIFWAPR